jgi:site-specific recombinase XerD
MEEDLILRGLSSETQYRYQRDARLFLDWADRPADAMGEEDIRAYLRHLIVDRALNPITVNVCNSALRFLYAVTLDRNLNYRQVPRLKESHSLPEILTRHEVARVFDHASTLQNRAILITIYGAGLRVSEVCKLQVRDIDSESMRILVRHGKRDKDRYTLLSQKNLDILREYWKAYRPRHPDGWLSLSKNGLGRMHCTTVQEAMATAAKRAGISKRVTPHTLRHCFATHLLEAGTDIYSIKRLLGHAQIQSTTVYLHLTNFEPKLRSPLDDLPQMRKPQGWPRAVNPNA